ncbi:MAG: hypothetical protein ACLQD9_04540 [Thermoplasmata archaeon]
MDLLRRPRTELSSDAPGAGTGAGAVDGSARAAMAAVPTPEEKLSPARGLELTRAAFPAGATGAGTFSRPGVAAGGIAAGVGVEREGAEPVDGGEDPNRTVSPHDGQAYSLKPLWRSGVRHRGQGIGLEVT